MSSPLSSLSFGLFSAESAVATEPPRSVRAAREFEASLVAALLASLEKSFAAVPGESSLAGSDDYDYLATRALADGIAAQGGFGIATMISRNLAAHESKGQDVMKE